MADISKIILPNGNSYNIKDETARSTGKVSGVKGNAESSYRTGNVNLTAANIGAVPVGPVMSTNPFAGDHGANLLYLPKIDNALYCAGKRFNVSVSGEYMAFNGVDSLFNGNYDSENLKIDNNKQVTITLSFDNTSSGYFPGYPYGTIYCNFYYTRIPKTITGRVYCNYEPHTIGWHDLVFTNVFGSVYAASQSWYNISIIEITITGGAADNGRSALTEIDFWLSRPNPNNTPFLSKYGAETLYYPLTAPNFIGSGSQLTNLNAGNITSGTLLVARGGTGQTSEINAANAFINALSTGSDDPVDNDYFISQYVNGGTTTKTYHRRPMSKLWNYISGKISSVLGLTASTYSGSAAKVNNHTVAVDVPSGAEFTDTTYSISMSGNRITLTPSSGTATYVDLPVYDGTVV